MFKLKKGRIKSAISLLLVLLVSLTSVPFCVNAATTYRLSFYDTYDSDGNLIVSKKQMGKLHSNLQESMFKINGERAYCIELDVPADGTRDYIQNSNSANSVWNKGLNQLQRNLVNMILCFGLESKNKTSAGTKTINGHSIQFYKMYGYTVSVYEAYMATQLLIWEITEGYRSLKRPYTSTKYRLCDAYTGMAGKNIKLIYDAIVSNIKNFNVNPSFTSKNKNDAPEYKLRVTYNPSSGYSIATTSMALTDRNGCLSNYTSLATNRSISFKGYKGETKYLNVKASISGNKLTLTPASVSSSATYSTTSKMASSIEQNVPQTSTGKLIAYGEAEKKDIQDIVCGGTLDPVYAYFSVGVDYDYESSNRNFRVKKSARDKLNNTELANAESGWYFYVRMPKANAEYGSGRTSTFNYYDSTTDSVVSAECYSQNAASYLGLTTTSISYNKELDEHYMILGPTTFANGETGTIKTYLRRYINSTIGTENGKEVPYGNYYIFELGKKTSNFSPTNSINGETSNIDMNPEHYAIPTGCEPYHFTYQEHKNGNKRDGIDAGSNEYYKRLKRLLCNYKATEITTSTYVNYMDTKVRISKTADDGNISDVYFKLTKYNSSGGVASTSTIGPTNSDGYIEKWLSGGNYKIEEIGYSPSGGIPSYVNVPDPIEFSIDEESFNEYYENGYYELNFVNSATINIRVIKSDTADDSKQLNGAVYGIYNTKDKLLETLPATKTTTIGNITYEGFAQSADSYAFGDYYVKEISAPDGYLVDETKHPITVSNANLDRDVVSGIPIVRNRLTVRVADDKTECYVSKKALTGDDELPGAKLKVTDKDGNTVDEWTSGIDPHKIEGLVFDETYTLTETVAPNGYATTNSINFTYTENQQTVVMRDDTTKFEILKVDEENNPLQNAVLQLYDENNTIIDEWKTEGETHKIYGELVVGKTYRLHEKSTPNSNYKLAQDISFTVKDTANVQTVTMVNELYYGSVTLQKQDGDGNSLAGAEFALYKADGTAVLTTKETDGNYTASESGDNALKVDSDGTLKVSGIELGNYYFIETKAPEGKMPYTDKIEFTISSENEDTLNPSLVVKDNSIVALNTGGNGYGLPLMIGFIFIGLSACGIYFVKNFRRKKQ